MGVLSYQQAKRIRQRVKREGIKGVVHRNRTPEIIRELVL